MPAVRTLFDHKLAITIGALDPAVFHRNLQPNTRMSTLTAVAINAIRINFFGLWDGRAHIQNSEI